MFNKFRLLFILVIVLGVISQSFGQKKNSPRAVFTNSTPITINSVPGTVAPPIPASLYPSNINVSGMTGNITRVAVTLTGLTKERMSDLDFLLVSPSGAKFIFLSDGQNGGAVPPPTDAVYTFADDATDFFPGLGLPVYPGNYKPTSGDTGTDTFPAPAPAAPYNQPNTATFASTFNGTSPNGTWSLYVVDDTLFEAGSLNSGWALTITTTGSPQTFANSAFIGFNDMQTSASPYGTAINVAGMSGVVSSLKVSLNGFSHQQMRDIDIMLVSPNGRSLVLMSDVSSGSVTNLNLTFDDNATSSVNTFPLNSGTYKPANVTNSFENFQNDAKDFFPTPAPLRPYFEDTLPPLSSFNGFNPNGEWRLYVLDDNSSNTGSISGGWSLDITTTPLVLAPIGCVTPSFSQTYHQTNASPTNLTVGDFNNDSKPDVIVANQVSNDISLLLGTGTGDFLPQTVIASGGSGAYGIAAGNFNADSNLDFVVTNSGSNNISVFLGNGNGTFSSPTNYLVGASPLSVAIGDFNNDNKKDLAVANFGGFFSGTVSILLGNGTGGFSLPTNLRTRTQPAFVLIGRFNSDNNDDLAVANFGSNNISIFYGNGTSSPTLGQTLQAGGAGPVAIDYDDVSGDKTNDLIIANFNSNVIRTIYGNGNGFLISSGFQIDVGENPIALLRANLLGSNTESTITSLNGVDQISIIENFNIIKYTVGLYPYGLGKGDFNADGKVDLVVANSGSNNVSLLTNSCSFTTENLIDFDGNRATDLSIHRPIQSRWLSSNISSGFSIQDRVFARPTDKLVPADYDGDGKTDYAIYRPESGLWFVINRFNQPIHFQGFGLPTDIPVPADYDGDRKADIAVFRPSDGTWYVRRSSDNVVLSIPFGSNGDKPVPADYDGDRKSDIAVYRPSAGSWYILRSSDLQFVAIPFGISTDKTVQGDYDGDGKADVAVYRDGIWYVQATTAGFIPMAWGNSTDLPVPGDYDADGKFDFAVFRSNEGTWYIRRSSLGDLGFGFGVSTDYPIPNTFVK